MRATIMLANIATIVFLFGMFFVQKDINFALMAFSLLCLGGLGEVAINEQESFDKAYMHHYYENVVQKECMHLNVGDLYKPFDVKPTLITRILMTKVGGAK